MREIEVDWYSESCKITIQELDHCKLDAYNPVVYNPAVENLIK